MGARRRAHPRLWLGRLRRSRRRLRERGRADRKVTVTLPGG